MHPKILFVGGGSIGHIAPSVAVCEVIGAKADAHFICADRPDEKQYLESKDLAYTTIDAPRLGLTFPWKFFQAYRQAKRIINQHNPNALFSKGGYVSVPMCLAAKHKKIPIVLHESDVVSGYANRIVSRWATAICTGFPTTINDQRSTHTGNPITTASIQGSKEEGLRIAGIKDDKPTLLVIGGSQGSLIFNNAIEASIENLLQVCNVVHITGRGKRSTINDQPGYFQQEFATHELPHFYAAADIALSRASSGILSELAANGIPTIVVPLRDVGHDHQKANADSAEATGGCIQLDEDTLENTLYNGVKSIAENADQRIEMSESIAALSTKDSAQEIAEILLQACN